MVGGLAPAAELEIVVCSDKFVGRALVPTKLLGTAVPTNLSEHTTIYNSALRMAQNVS